MGEENFEVFTKITEGENLGVCPVKTGVFWLFTLIYKIDKLGIEITTPFVYNVFIAVLGTVNHRKEIYTYVHS